MLLVCYGLHIFKSDPYYFWPLYFKIMNWHLSECETKDSRNRKVKWKSLECVSGTLFVHCTVVYFIGLFQKKNCNPFQGGQWKNSSGVTVNLNGNPGGQLKQNRYPQKGEGTIFFWKSPLGTSITMISIVFLS